MRLPRGKILILLLMFFCIFLGFKYRTRQYQIIPKVNATFDELQYLWLGKSLLSTGVPASWSNIYIYMGEEINGDKVIGHAQRVEKFNIIFDEITPFLINWWGFPKPVAVSTESSLDGYRSQFRIVQPQLDNPPLTGIILAIFDRSTSIFSTTVAQIRLVPIILLSLTVGTVFLLGLYISNLKTGIISALIYALGPGFVISSRLAVPENMLAALFPVSLLTLLFYLRSPSPKKLMPLLIISFLSPLFKMSGVIIPLALAAVFLHRRLYRQSLVIVAAMLGGVSLYIGYGLFYESELFLRILSVHSERDFLGPIALLVKIIYPEIPVPMFEGWLLLGYISLFILMRLKSYLFSDLVIFGVISYFLFYTIFGGENYPWYQFIVFPLLALSAGIVVEYFIRLPSLQFNLTFFFVTLSSMLHYTRFSPFSLDYLNSYRLFALVFVVAPIGLFLFRDKYNRFLQGSLIAMLFLGLFLGTRIINNMQVLYPYLEKAQYPLGQAYCCNGLPKIQ